MENPFFYGTTVSGKSFTNRQKEIKEIVGDLKSGQNLFIYSPRRYGKTSLIKVVLEKLKKERFATIYLDFYQIYSKRGTATVLQKPKYSDGEVPPMLKLRRTKTCRTL